jgi:pyruvate,water dikinase
VVGWLRWLRSLPSPQSGGGDDATDSGGADAGLDEVVLVEQACEIDDGDEAPHSVARIGCRTDFDALSSEPLVASIPGARTLKVVVDRSDANALHFQNSKQYLTHHAFAEANLSGGELPVVGSPSDFIKTEYSSPDRRFVLASVTYYEGPDVWALELAPGDTATPEMVETLYAAIVEHAYFGPALALHIEAAELARLGELGASLRLVDTETLFAAIDYQPLNLGTTIGRLRFMKEAELDTEYVTPRDVLVLDAVPNDLSVVSGLITEAFQTPLSHVNVLSQNRGTPNMGLRGATTHGQLRALEGEWVELTVGAFDWNIEPATSAEADAYWAAHKPAAVQVPNLDLATTGLHDIETLVDADADDLRAAIRAAIPAFGGKAAHYAVLAQTDGLRVPKAFGVPVYYYDQFMRENGFAQRVSALQTDAEFLDDPARRDAELQKLRDDMLLGTVNQELQDLLTAKLQAEFPATSMRFRSSTNAEDLDGFTGAGLYTSKTGKAGDWPDTLDAIREVWSSVWHFRAFEERTFRSIDHSKVGMALLVAHSFPDEEANGVALTGNLFDTSGLEPGFYVNVQLGDTSVVQPDTSVTSDAFLIYYAVQGQPLEYLSHSSLVPHGETVLTRDQVLELSAALQLIHMRFAPAYAPPPGSTEFYGMDVEFKFDGEPGETPVLNVKQARPHPGRGQ